MLCLAVALFIAYLYALLLYASLVVAFGANHTCTLAHYHVIFTEGRKAIRDTLIIALIGMPLGGFYGVLVGYLVARKQFAGRRAMEIVSMINYALPGTIVGHRLSHRLQRSADRADRHARSSSSPATSSATARPASAPPSRCCTRSTSSSRKPREPRRAQRHHLPPRHAAAGAAGLLRRSRRRLHPLDDGDQRDDLPGLDRLDADHGAHPREHDRAFARARPPPSRCSSSSIVMVGYRPASTRCCDGCRPPPPSRRSGAAG